ncbi:NADH dehydrogenase [ubiquinone] 1 beta subcomplex subunit 9 [Halyomorpha halys]|uniref:NADH dehydrogenase [ubiquinone] 1 beta subcomplex subunit 9 n=1 Tax=Halyomorpha halys TaxID=286706 RepID=UPI0006D4C855|nr:NADH dehydrogenase [ubiquinone] 1 beta subcomplex subunit 9 [Halyomorpha halys]
MATQIPFAVKTHKQKVLSLYKRIIRNLESWYYYRPVFRYQATLMRARFDENKKITDEVKAARLLKEGEEELAKKVHYMPKQFPLTIGGNAYDRAAHIPDWVLDYWHPLEKAQYPEYFKRREERKIEYMKMYERQYGPQTPNDHHH